MPQVVTAFHKFFEGRERETESDRERESKDDSF